MRLTLLVSVRDLTGWSELVVEHLRALEAPPNSSLEIVLLLDRHSTEEAKVFYTARLPTIAQVTIDEVRDGGHSESDAWIVIDDRTLPSQAWLLAFVEAATRHVDADVLIGRTEMFFTSMPPPELMRAFPELSGGFAYPIAGRDDASVKGSRPFLLINVLLRNHALRTAVIVHPLDHGWTVATSAGRIVWAPSISVPRWTAPDETSNRALASYLRALGATSTVQLEANGAWQPAPRWVWRRLVEAMIGYVATKCGVTSHVPSPLYSAYVSADTYARLECVTLWWREFEYLRGIVRPGRLMSASWPRLPRPA